MLRTLSLSGFEADNPILTLRRVGEARVDVVLSQLRVIEKNFLVRHPRRKPTKHVGHSQAHPANRRFAGTNERVDGDAVLEVHGSILIP